MRRASGPVLMLRAAGTCRYQYYHNAITPTSEYVKKIIIYFGKSMKKMIVSFSSLPTITQGTSPTHRPIFAYRKP